MGTKMGPSYANLFIGFIEHQFFRKIRKAMCQFFDKRGYPVSVVQAGHHRAQQIDRQHYKQLRK